MPTVIDSLVVELGMDTRKLKEGEREGYVTIEEFKRRLSTVGTTAEKAAESAGNFFTILKGGIFGVLAALTIKPIVDFVERVMQMDAQTSRLSRTLGANTRELSVWQGVMKQVGGTAESANATFANLSDALAGFRLGLGMPSGPFAFVMSQMGLDIRRSRPSDILRGASIFAQQQLAAGRDPSDVRVMLQQIPGVGGNEPLLATLMKGPQALSELMKNVEKTGVLTAKQGDAAEQLLQKQGVVEIFFDRLGSKSLPALNTAVNELTASFRKQLDAWNNLTGGGKSEPAPAATPGSKSLPFTTSRLSSLPYNSITRDLGATGRDPATGNAIFPDEASTTRALDFFKRMEGFKTNPEGARRSIERGTSGQLFHYRPIPELTKTPDRRSGNTTTINVAAINVTSNRADPRAVAAAVPEELKRVLLAGRYDWALG